MNLKVMIDFESENLLNYVALVIIIEKAVQNSRISLFPGCWRDLPKSK